MIKVGLDFCLHLEPLAISNYKFSAFLTAKASVIKAGLDFCVHLEPLAISNSNFSAFLTAKATAIESLKV